MLDIANFIFIPLDRFGVHFLLAVFLFFIINFLGKESYSNGYVSLSIFEKIESAPIFNFTLRILSPLVYIILISTFFYFLKSDYFINNIFLVSFYYVFIRFFSLFLLQRHTLINWVQELFFATLIISFSLIIYDPLIINKDNLLPSLDSIKEELWFGIFFFLYKIFNNKETFIKFSNKDKKNKYIYNKYKSFKNKYKPYIYFDGNIKLQKLAYSIIIVENFNRPFFIRIIENFLFKMGKAKSLGIMQVNTAKKINDLESIKLGCSILNNRYLELLIEYNSQDEPYYKNFEEYFDYHGIFEISNFYNPSTEYYQSVSEVYSLISSFSEISSQETDIFPEYYI